MLASNKLYLEKIRQWWLVSRTSQCEGLWNISTAFVGLQSVWV